MKELGFLGVYFARLDEKPTFTALFVFQTQMNVPPAPVLRAAPASTWRMALNASALHSGQERPAR